MQKNIKAIITINNLQAFVESVATWANLLVLKSCLYKIYGKYTSYSHQAGYTPIHYLWYWTGKEK